jgi:ribonuclease Z
LHPEEYIQEALDVEGLEEELLKVRRNLSIADTKSSAYPKVTFMGTGSCIPNKNRNTSGILIETR